MVILMPRCPFLMIWSALRASARRPGVVLVAPNNAMPCFCWRRVFVWVRARSARLWETARLARALGEGVGGRVNPPQKGVLKTSTGLTDSMHFGGLAETISKSGLRGVISIILVGWPRI